MINLSIIVISYNQHNYIQQAIDSILIQQMPFDFEIIVADDGSKDDTLQIIKNTFNGVVENLKILDNSENLGISKNYQRAFAVCQGQYIAVIEGDDYWTDPERLIKHIDFLDQHRECVMSMNRHIRYYENLHKFLIPKWDSSEDYKYVTTQDMIAGNKLGNLSACVFRKSEIDKIKPELYSLSISDWMLGIVLSQNGFIAIFKEFTSVYRIHNKGVYSGKLPEDRLKSLLKNLKAYNHFLEYKYDNEFNAHSEKLRTNYIKSIILKFNFVDFLPPILVWAVRLLIPRIILKFIKIVYLRALKLISSL